MTVTIKINPDVHKIVVVWGSNTFGFVTLATAIGFIEQQSVGVNDYSKLVTSIATAMSDDKDDDLQIFDIESYVDLFMDDEDEDV